MTAKSEETLWQVQVWCCYYNTTLCTAGFSLPLDLTGVLLKHLCSCQGAPWCTLWCNTRVILMCNFQSDHGNDGLQYQFNTNTNINTSTNIKINTIFMTQRSAIAISFSWLCPEDFSSWVSKAVRSWGVKIEKSLWRFFWLCGKRKQSAG